jgi:uncharacterized protein YjbJ (UPF0337 family)
MTGKIQSSKGKVEVAVGSLTGNKDLESKGKVDRKTGEVEEQIEDDTKKVEQKVIEVIDKAKGTRRHQ